MMHRFAILSMLLVIGVPTGWVLLAAPEPQQETITDDIKPVMQRKLDHSKSLLEALALEDFDSLSRNAQAMSLLSLESNWQVLTTEEYLNQSADFRRSLELIRTAAKDENIDRAALGYVDVTIRCVECHKYLRSNLARQAQEESDVR